MERKASAELSKIVLATYCTGMEMALARAKRLNGEFDESAFRRRLQSAINLANLSQEQGSRNVGITGFKAFRAHVKGILGAHGVLDSGPADREE